MRLRKVTALAVLSSGLVFCTAIQGQETGTVSVRERIAQGYEEAPTRADLEVLTDDLDRALVAIYRDPDVGMLEKMRALDLLEGHASEALHGLLVQELERDQLDGALRRRLLAATMTTYGESDPNLAARALQSAFESNDTLLRYEAARTLETHPDAALVESLGRKALATEADPEVRATIQRALGGEADRP